MAQLRHAAEFAGLYQREASSLPKERRLLSGMATCRKETAFGFSGEKNHG